MRLRTSSRNSKLTGRVRHSTSFSGKLVLQVEEHLPDGPPDSNGMPIWLEHIRWRFACVEDLAQLGRIYSDLQLKKEK